MLNYRTKGPQPCYSCEGIVSCKAKKCLHCGAYFPGLYGFSRVIRNAKYNFGFVPFVTYTCVALYIVSLVLDPLAITSNVGFEVLSPSNKSVFMLGATGAFPIAGWGRWWTVLSSGWLHGGLMHIAFNLIWIRQLAPIVTRAYGAAKLTLIYVISTVTSALLTSWVAYALPGLPTILQGAHLSVGASGGVFGLFGALIVHGQQMGEHSIKQQAITYAAVGFCMGFLWGNIDNWGHLGGFLGGYFATQLPWLTSRYAQTSRHVFAAFGCLVLVMTSIFASLIHALWMINVNIPG